MSELEGFVRTACEVLDIELSWAYGSGWPLAKTACHHSMGTGASIVHTDTFLTCVGALGMWPHLALESRQGGCT